MARARSSCTVSGVPEARRAATRGPMRSSRRAPKAADVGLMGTVALVPGLRAVLLVIAAEDRDGRGLAAALALGARSSGRHALHRDSRGSGRGRIQRAVSPATATTRSAEIPDVAREASLARHSRVVRNRLIETWAGREGGYAPRSESVPRWSRPSSRETHGSAALHRSGRRPDRRDRPAADIVRQMVADADRPAPRRRVPYLAAYRCIARCVLHVGHDQPAPSAPCAA
jgi:hypothetical protein